MPLRVLVVTQDDPFYMPHFFAEFFDKLPKDVYIDSIVLLDLFDESKWDFVKRMYGLYGVQGFIQRGCQYVYRKALTLTGKPYSVKNVVRDHGVSVVERSSVNRQDFVDYIQDANIDVILSVSAPEIFNSHVLDSPSWGCINVHTSDLPKYRGMLPTFWAMYHGDEEIGVTVHTMVEEIDRGEVIRKSYFPVQDEDTLDDVIVRGKKTGGQTAAAALRDIALDKVELRPIGEGGSYFSFPSSEERAEFQRRGGELL